MPGVETYPLSVYQDIAAGIQDSGVNSVLVFGVPSHKDSCGTGAYERDGVVQKAMTCASASTPTTATAGSWTRTATS